MERANSGIIGLQKAHPELKSCDSVETILKEMVAAAKKLNMAFNLSISGDGVPELADFTFVGDAPGWIKETFNGAKQLTHAVATTIKTVPELVKQVQEVINLCGELPSKTQKAAQEAGLNPLATAKALKSLAVNVKQVSVVPGELQEEANKAKDLTETLAGIFNA